MDLWAVVPVKPLVEGKSRLAGVLAEEKRVLLGQAMLELTLKTLSAVAEIDKILVISRDPLVFSLAQKIGAETLLEDCRPELNASLDCATRCAAAGAAGSLLILPVDLPLVSAEDIRGLIHCGRFSPGIVIAPDRHRNGTNALMATPPGIIPYCFGAGSFNRHIAAAEKSSIPVEICETASFGLDIDLPEDLDDLKRLGVTLF